MKDNKTPKGNLGERFYGKVDFLKGIRIKLEEENI